tara:strand:- start:13594 stop:16185 length:2592 start_codon:yes stop_codon:yes gene_type:complete
MTQEILYTSAPEGLKPGSSGFCTVVSTSGMAQNLAMKLESMSGYRHAFPPHSSEAKFNPVNYSHLTIQIGGRKYHVLSRISDAGLDYTQRSNKLAHHVALDQTDLPPAGPAALLATPGFSSVQWDGQVQLIPRRPGMESAHVATGPCHAWKNTMGDAGWAGVVASHLLTKPDKTISIIFPRGTDTLALVCEVFSLLPENQRWQTTFSTYFTKLPAGMDCQLRFVLDGTSESTALRRHPHVAVIDLAAPAEVTESHPLITLARTGQIEKPRPPVPRKPVPVFPTHPVAGKHSSAEETPEFEVTEQDLVTNAENAGIYQYGKPQGRPANGQRLPGAHLPHQKQANYSRLKRRRNLLLKWLMGGSFLLILLLLTFLAGSWVGKNNSSVPADNSAQGTEPATTDTKPNPDQGNQLALAEPETTTAKTNPPPAASESKPATTKEMDETAGSKTTKPEPEPVAEKPLAKTDPFVDIASKGYYLQLPDFNSTENKALAKVFLEPEQQLDLAVQGGKLLFNGNADFKIEPGSGTKSESTWKVIKFSENQLSGKSEIGIFQLKDNLLSYKWAGEKNKDDFIFQFAILSLSINKKAKPVLCKINTPQRTHPLEMKSSSAATAFAIETDIPIPDVLKSASQHIYLEINKIDMNSELTQDISIPQIPLQIVDATSGQANVSKDQFTVEVLARLAPHITHLSEKNIPRFKIDFQYTLDREQKTRLEGRLYAYPWYIIKNYGQDEFAIVSTATPQSDEINSFIWSNKHRTHLIKELKDTQFGNKALNMLDQKIKKEESKLEKNANKKEQEEARKAIAKWKKQKAEIKDILTYYPEEHQFFDKTFMPGTTCCRIHYRLFLKIEEHEIDISRSGDSTNP